MSSGYLIQKWVVVAGDIICYMYMAMFFVLPAKSVYCDKTK